MATIVLTDLTRFNNEGLVCTAGIDTSSGVCIRPLPYLTRDFCRRRTIMPGTLLSADFGGAEAVSPHIEDRTYAGVDVVGTASSSCFRDALVAGLCDGLGEGFGVAMPAGAKFVPVGNGAIRSLITLSVAPESVDLFLDGYGKLRLHFKDSIGDTWTYISVTDLGLYEYAERHQSARAIHKVKRFVAQQEEVFLRIGLSRRYQAQDGREGYWVQCNGIYSFPDFYRELRACA